MRRETDRHLRQVQDTDKFWQWVHGVVMDEVRAQNWYNGDAPWGLRGFMNDRVNRILGYPIMRQIRIVNDSCTCVSPLFRFRRLFRSLSRRVDRLQAPLAGEELLSLRRTVQRDPRRKARFLRFLEAAQRSFGPDL